jgi:hypothetical protein
MAAGNAESGVSGMTTANPATPAVVTNIATSIQVWIQSRRRRSAWISGSDSASGRS